MDERPTPWGDDSERFANYIAGRFDGPAFARRDKTMRAAFDQLLRRCRDQRDQELKMVRSRLAVLHGLAGGWSALRPWLAEGQIATLEQLHAELAPKPRTWIEPTTARGPLKRALRELADSITTFNERWQRFLDKVDVSPVNALRDGYNRYYVLEKECALGSARLARLGFEPVEPLTREEIVSLFPPLPIPHLTPGKTPQ